MQSRSKTGGRAWSKRHPAETFESGRRPTIRRCRKARLRSLSVMAAGNRARRSDFPRRRNAHFYRPCHAATNGQGAECQPRDLPPHAPAPGAMRQDRSRREDRCRRGSPPATDRRAREPIRGRRLLRAAGARAQRLEPDVARAKHDRRARPGRGAAQRCLQQLRFGIGLGFHVHQRSSLNRSIAGFSSFVNIFLCQA